MPPEVAPEPSRLVVGVHAGTIHGLPKTSALSGLSPAERYQAIKNAGYALIQDGDDDLAQDAGLARAGMGRVIDADDADRAARDGKSRGHGSITLHVGTGFESDEEADALVASILTASAKHGIPLYVETHRATITQDPWRTLRLIDRNPEVRFTGDFSHWYTGAELVYGDFDAKLDAIQPVFDRVRFIHGRIGTPGSIQVDVGDGLNRPFVEHFRQIWTRTFEAFLRSADPRERIAFVPELLSPTNYYARHVRSTSGDQIEEGDRWQQASLLSEIAIASFADAMHRSTRSPGRYPLRWAR